MHTLIATRLATRLEGIPVLLTTLIQTLLQQYCCWQCKTVSVLLEKPCNKSESRIKLVTRCEQLVPNLLKQYAPENKFMSRLVTTCSQVVILQLNALQYTSRNSAGMFPLVRFMPCVVNLVTTLLQQVCISY